MSRNRRCRRRCRPPLERRLPRCGLHSGGRAIMKQCGLDWGVERRRPCMSSRPAPTHINLADKLGSFSDHWAPKIVARYNDNEVRLVKTSGEWLWHKHDETD